MICESLLSQGQVIPFISEKSLSPSEKYSVQTWNTENGLPQNSVNDIAQTNDGYLWMGTFDGLVRFDGIKFTTYNTSNTPQLKNNGIKHLFTDRKDKLWIVVADGSLASYFQNKFQSYFLPAKVIFNNNAITNWADNSVLIACENGKIYKIKNETATKFSLPEYIGNVKTILSKYDDQLYVGTEAGLYSYSNDEWQRFDAFNEKRIFALYSSPSNDIIANIENDLFVIYSKKAERLDIPLDLSTFANYTLGFNEQKQLTVSTDQGLYIIQGNTVSSITTQNGLSSNAILSVFVDKQNNFWIGTSNGGVNKLKTKIFHTLSKENGMNDDITSAIIETSEKEIFIANNCEGVSRYANGRFSRVPQPIHGACVWSIYEDPSKNIWFGTYGGGLFLKTKKGLINEYSIREGLPGNAVFSIYSDSEKKFWVGTDKGLAYFEENKFISFDPTFINTITFIFEDRNKQLFLCTDKGLATINNKKIVVLENGSLKNVNVRYVYEDADGALWIGTHGRGLIRFKNGKTFSFSPSTPLDNNVWSIMEDRAGNFWLPSNSGLYVVGRKELNDYAEGTIKNLNPLYLSKEDGLKSIEFNGGFQPAALRSSTGEFWFPTAKGVAIVNPANLSSSDYVPQLVIEKITIDDLPIEIKDTITLQSFSNQALIFFTAPSFLNPAKLNFQYKIEGLDNKWIDNGTRREIKLTNLSYGTHILRMRVCGSAISKETSIIIHKPLPFWQETKFIIATIFIFVLIMIIVGAGIIDYIRKREEKKTQLNKQYANIELKALQAQMNPHFLYNCLNSIQHFIFVHDEISASKYLSKFSSLMRMFLEHSKSNAVTLQEEIELLRLYTDLESLRFKNRFTCHISIDPETDLFNVEVPSMLFQPFVENAIAHGLAHLNGGGRLDISFIVEDTLVTGIIEDNGIGRKKAEELKSATSQDHISRGTELINDRIAILNKMENTNIVVQVIDKTDDDGNAAGTRIIIKIPI
jgi:ligand-binding sensor domain-containing protein